MMVNQINNNSVPWPNTIPDQMPWLNSSACPPGAPMQFVGEQHYPNSLGQAPLPIAQSQPPQNVDNQEMPAPLGPTLQPITSPEPNPMIINNPFYPQQASVIQFAQMASPAPLDASAMEATSAQLPYGQVPMANAAFEGSLTQIPTSQPMPSFEPPAYSASSHKRSSFEMDEGLSPSEAPPTKQQLSENNLFQRFGSLHLDNELSTTTSEADKIDCEGDAELETDSEPGTSTSAVQTVHDRKEFNRYVYLLFKDKKPDGKFPSIPSGAVDRLIREEREKLSKAVILWNPPPRTNLFDEPDAISSGSDDDEFNYKDHTDFLKDSESSVIITEVDDDGAPINEDVEVEADGEQAEDRMLE